MKQKYLETFICRVAEYATPKLYAGWQNMPPKKMPLWCKDYLGLEARKKKQIKEKLFVLYLPKSRT